MSLNSYWRYVTGAIYYVAMYIVVKDKKNLLTLFFIGTYANNSIVLKSSLNTTQSQKTKSRKKRKNFFALSRSYLNYTDKNK